MGTVAAIGSLVIGAAGIAQQRKQARKAEAASEKASNYQKLSQSEQKAQAAQEQAAARRREIREERVRRARILQSAENTGTAESSGSLGAQSALSTNYASQQGQAISASLSGERQTSYLQSAADANYAVQGYMAKSDLYGQIGRTGFSIFNSTLGSLGGSTSPVNPTSVGGPGAGDSDALSGWLALNDNYGTSR